MTRALLTHGGLLLLGLLWFPLNPGSVSVAPLPAVTLD